MYADVYKSVLTRVDVHCCVLMCKSARKSKHKGKTQSTVCLSSGEAKLRSIGDGLAQAIGLQSIARYMGIHWRIDLYD